MRGVSKMTNASIKRICSGTLERSIRIEPFARIVYACVMRGSTSASERALT